MTASKLSEVISSPTARDCSRPQIRAQCWTHTHFPVALLITDPLMQHKYLRVCHDFFWHALLVSMATVINMMIVINFVSFLSYKTRIPFYFFPKKKQEINKTPWTLQAKTLSFKAEFNKPAFVLFFHVRVGTIQNKRNLSKIWLFGFNVLVRLLKILHPRTFVKAINNWVLLNFTVRTYCCWQFAHSFQFYSTVRYLLHQ